MKKKHIFLLLAALVLTTLIFTLSGCAGSDDSLEGKTVFTFDINEGILNYGTSSTRTKINFAYTPGTYVIDPTEIPGYKIFRSGYVFTGWYTSAECKSNEKWNFNTLAGEDNVTLFAGWEIEIKYTYGVYYSDGENQVSLGSYSVNSGEKFDDFQKIANKRENYTPLGYYSDAACTTPWNEDYTHPGGDSDLEIPVYVKYIEGEWALVDSFETLASAIYDSNVYLLCDIDCAGAELDTPDTFKKIFEGNGYTVSNFIAPQKSKQIRKPTCSIFDELAETAVIRNVSFENVTYDFDELESSTETVTVQPGFAALTVTMEKGAKIDSVSVSGVLKTNTEETFASLEAAYWYQTASDSELDADIKDFTANITVDKQS